MRRIVAAALVLDGFVAIVPRPGRHHTILHSLADAGFPTPIGGIQGFIDSDGYFVGRKEAMTIARAAQQLIPREGQYGPDGDLFSEDLW